MRYLRYAFLAVIGIVLVSVSLANRQPVTLRLLPDGLETLVPANPAVSLPLFAVILGGIAAGLILGFFWEWMREYKHRREAARKAREVRQLERQVNKLRQDKNAGKDEVLALLEEAN